MLLCELCANRLSLKPSSDEWPVLSRADGDALSGNQIFDLSITAQPFYRLCIHEQGGIFSCRSSVRTEPNHNPMKWCQDEQSSYSPGLESQSLHPNPEEMGKWSFQLTLMARPGALGLRGPQSSDVLQLILLSCFKIAGGWQDHGEPAAITTLCIHSHFLQQQQKQLHH